MTLNLLAACETPLMDGFRRRLADAIEQRGWSARELSARAGLAEGHVSMMLGGKYAGKRPTMESVTALAHALGVNLDWLANGKGKPGFTEYSALPPRPKKPRPLPPENASLVDARDSDLRRVALRGGCDGVDVVSLGDSSGRHVVRVRI